MRRQSDPRHGFTLLEALIAATILCSGVALLWEGYVVHLRMQSRLDAEVDALSDLASVSEALSLDAEACTALPRRAGWADLELPTADGVVHWTDQQGGLVRRAPDGRVRRFRSLHAKDLVVETVGPRMVVIATVRGPGDLADVVLARAVPIGIKR